MKKPSHFIAIFLILLSLLSTLFTACTTSQVNEGDPATLFKEAEEDIDSSHYQIAIDKLRYIKNKFPYSKYATDAQLRIADVYFLQDSFAEAAVTYEAFRELHPKHEKTAYAMFRAGKAYYKDLPGTVARDLTTAKKALDAYNDFLRRYPTTGEANEARTDVVEIRKLLADKELYVADFYFKRDFYDSAKPRYKKIIELYPESEAAKVAAEKLTQIEAKTP
jgi:outer membrane protein assembly factor BamD